VLTLIHVTCGRWSNAAAVYAAMAAAHRIEVLKPGQRKNA